MPISTIRHCILDLNNLKQVLVHDLLSTINIVSFVIFLTALNFGHLHCSYFKMFQSSCFLTSKTITLRYFVFMQTNFAFCQYFFYSYLQERQSWGLGSRPPDFAQVGVVDGS